jgi:ligand-binding sensor domain-containing protein
LNKADINALAINSQGHIFAGTLYGSSGIFRSTDNGGNWTEAGLPDNDLLCLAINSQGDIFGGTYDNGAFRSTNNGASWIDINNGLTNHFVFSFAINASGHIFAGTDSGVFYSTDNGANWRQTGLSRYVITALAINSRGHIFAGTAHSGVIRSTDNGVSWTQINSGLTDTDVWCLAINPQGQIFAGTNGGGVFRSVQSTITSIDEIVVELPLSFTLEQNYPNPFNPSTTIRFSLPIAAEVILKIVDSLGREVEILINGKLNPGEYSIPWNAVGQTSGVYFYRLRAGDFVQTKKLVLLK